MVAQSNKFRVFVSSTFRDFKQERDALQREVYPRLREYCQERGAVFQAVDLRWGISEAAGQDQRTVEICLNEIRRCQEQTRRPNFLLLLGDRYGWQPLPVSIPADEWDAILPHVSNPELLKQWYRRDDNAVPPAYILQPSHGVDNWWDDTEKGIVGIETQLREMLQSAVPSANLSAQQRIKYETSATEQEIHAGIFNYPDAHESAITIIRTIEGLPDTENDYFEADTDAQAKLETLRERLQPYQPMSLTATYENEQLDNAYITEFCEQVYQSLVQMIDAELSEQQELTPLEQETSQHEAFAAARSQNFIGRDDVLRSIEAYLQSDESHPLVVHGQSGVGKTSIMAQVIQRHPNAMYRFIGATPNSADIQRLLNSLCEEINQRTGQQTEIPSEYNKLTQAFPEFLAQASAENPLLIVLDALDQLANTNNPVSLSWFPAQLPPNVQVIVSVIPGEFLNGLRQRLPANALCPVYPMSRDTAENLLDAWLKNAHRTLQPDQRAEVLTKFEHNGLPLYLKLAFEEARLWRSYQGHITLAPEVHSLLRENLFARLSSPQEHGAVLVKHSMAYLATSRDGLAEEEVLDLLALSDEYWNHFVSTAHKEHELPERRVPIVVWSRLALDLDAYMVTRQQNNRALLNFYHRQFAETVDTLYLALEREANHAHLAAYYEAQPLSNLRKLTELTYQLFHADQLTTLRDLLLNFDYLNAKLNATAPTALIADFDYLPDDRPAQLIQSAIRMSTHILNHSPEQLPIQLYARLMSHAAAYPDIAKLLPNCTTQPHPNFIPQTQTTQPAGGALLRTLAGHRSIVNYVSLSGEYAVSASFDHTLKVWNWQSGELLRTLEGHTNSVNYVSLSGEYAVSASKDKVLKVWNWQSGELLRTLEGHTSSVRLVSLSGEYAVSASDDKTLKVWNWQSGALLRTLQGHRSIVNYVSLSGEYAVSASKDKVLKVWNWQTGALLRTLQHTGEVNAVSLSGEYAVSASKDKVLKVWNWKGVDTPWSQRGALPRTLEGHTDSVRLVSLSGEYAVSASDDKTLKVWNWQSGALLRTLQGHTQRVNAVSLSGEHAVSASDDKTLKVWNWQNGELLRTLQGHTGAGWSVSLSGEYAVSASNDHTLKVWNWRDIDTLAPKGVDKSELSMVAPSSQSGELLRTLRHTDAVRSVSLSGEYAVSASYDHTLKVWNWQSGALLRTLQGHTQRVNAVSLSGEYAVSASGFRYEFGSGGKTLKVWNWQTGALLRTLQGHTSSVLSVSLSGEYAVSASDDGMLRVWNWQSGELLRTLQGHSDAVFSVSLSGEYAVSASHDRTLRVWNWQSGELLRTLEGHTSSVLSVSLSGEYAVSASFERTLKVWNWQSGELLRTLEGHTGEVTAVSLSGEYTVSASFDHTLKVWNWHSGELLATFYADAPLWSVAIAPNFERIIVGDYDGNVHFLHPNAALLKILKGEA